MSMLFIVVIKLHLRIWNKFYHFFGLQKTYFKIFIKNVYDDHHNFIHGVTVIVTENGIGDLSSKSGQVCSTKG